MGLFANGVDPRGSSDIAAIMQESVAPWFDAHIRIVDPGVERRAAPVYDPTSDTWSGGDPADDDAQPVLWDSGPRGALVQPVRAQTLGDFGSQAVGLVAVRIQAIIPDEISLRSGLQIKVVDGGGDTEVERYTYVIGSGVDSSLRWWTRLTATVVT